MRGRRFPWERAAPAKPRATENLRVGRSLTLPCWLILVSLFVFGCSEPGTTVVTGEAMGVGYQITLRGDYHAQAPRKTVPKLAIDRSAVGKGYAVDRIAELLDEAGATDYLISFGGEVRAKGDGPGGDGWVVAVDVPGAAGKTLTVRDQAVATSGGSPRASGWG